MDEFLNMMVPDHGPNSSPLTPIATLAFIDLETTGLPSDVGRKNVHITELAIVAVDRTDFEDDLSLRVANKLTLFIRPRANISSGAMFVTKLFNDVLDKQKPFNDSIPEMLSLFFSRLRSPVCLVAHNGKGFDFPVLRAELKRIGYSLPADVTCVDTLEAFRTLGFVQSNSCSLEEMPDTTKDNSGNRPENGITDEQIDHLLNDSIEDFQKIQPHMFKANHIDVLSAEKSLGRALNEKTPERLDAVVEDCGRPKQKNKHIDSFFQQRKRTFNHSSNCKRELFMTMSDQAKKSKMGNITALNNKRSGFSLEKLYLHYIGEEAPKAHHADSDCINLCKVIQRVSNTLLPWFDQNQVLFSDQIPMW